MEKSIFWKSLVCGIVALFIGSCVVSSTANNMAVEKSSKTNVENLVTSLLPPLMWTEDFSTFYITTPQDPQGDQTYYMIDWGDGTSSGWIGPYEPDETVSISHEWGEEVTYQIKAKAKDQSGESKCAIYSLGLSSDLKFFGVETGYVDITYAFTFYWKEGNYYIFITWGDGQQGDWLGPYDESAQISHAWYSPGVYILKLRMKDVYGNYSEWLTLVITILPIGNNAPFRPDIKGKMFVKPGVKYNYTFKAIDPDGDNVSYQINWGDHTFDDWFGAFKSGEEITRNHSYPKYARIIVHARAKDIHGAIGEWSTFDIVVPQSSQQSSSTPSSQNVMSVIPLIGNLGKFSFLFKTNNPPYAPNNPIPGNGSTNMSICPPNISWWGGDPDFDSVTYDVYFGVNPYFLTLVAQDINVTWYQIPFLLEFNKKYYWKIVAWDEYGAKTEGPLWNFLTQLNQPPNPLIDPFPHDGADNVPVTGVTLSWSGGDPNPCDTVTYDVYFEEGDPTPDTLVSNNQTGTNYTPGDLEVYNIYYWMIVAHDSRGLSNSSGVWSFNTWVGIPDPPVILGPTKLKSGVEYKYTFYTIDWYWNDLYYWIEWGDQTNTGWIGPFESGYYVIKNHSWSKKGSYIIRAKIKDTYGLESAWRTLSVSVPRTISDKSILLKFLEQFPHAFPLLRKLLMQ